MDKELQTGVLIKGSAEWSLFHLHGPFPLHAYDEALDDIWCIVTSTAIYPLCSFDIKFAENMKKCEFPKQFSFRTANFNGETTAKIIHDKNVLDLVELTVDDILAAVNYGVKYVNESLTEPGDEPVPKGNTLQWLYHRKGIV
jgi:hypothetical protein